MRKLLFGLSLIILFVVGCCSHVVLPLSASGRAELISDETVALVMPGEGRTHVYCAGVWVARDVILTANHCIKGLSDQLATQEILKDAAAKGAGEEDLELLQGLIQMGVIKLPATDLMALPISFIIHEEVVGVGENTTAFHQGRVMSLLPEHDLALVQALNVPLHKVARLADKTPAVGEHIFTMGHPIGLYWSFMEGLVSAYHEHFAPTGDTQPLLQISMPIFHGNSGGGVFNSFGELVGVVSFMPPKVPDVGFCIPLESIRGFLAGAHLVKLDLTPKKIDPAL